MDARKRLDKQRRALIHQQSYPNGSFAKHRTKMHTRESLPDFEVKLFYHHASSLWETFGENSSFCIMTIKIIIHSSKKPNKGLDPLKSKHVHRTICLWQLLQGALYAAGICLSQSMFFLTAAL